MNGTEAIVFIVMCAVQVFMMFQIQKLIDKLMSKNYSEYVQTTNAAKPIDKPRSNGLLDLQDQDNDLDVLSELNGIG